jgi:hypothetical protein
MRDLRVFAAVKIHVKVFWVVKPCMDVAGTTTLHGVTTQKTKTQIKTSSSLWVHSMKSLVVPL